MQANAGMNTLLGLGATGQPRSDLAGETLPPGAAIFAMLLGDVGARADDRGKERHTLPLPSPSALTAQGLELPKEQPQPMLDQIITPADAGAMLQQLSTLLQHHDQNPSHEHNPHLGALTAVKEQLQQIVVSDTPKTLGQVLDAAPESKEPKLAGLLGGLIQAVKKAVAGHEEKHEEVSESVSVSAQLLSAAMFRPDDRAATIRSATSAKSAAKKQEIEADTTTIIEPLAFTTTTQMAVPVETTITQQPLAAPPTIDDLVPALAPVASKQSERTELPEINLPSMGMVDQSQKTAPTEHEDIAAAVTDSQISTPPLAHLQHAHASKTLDLMPTPGFINHATPKEQVHVAIAQAAQDGLDKITIQLEPGELGRVEVRLHTSREGLAQITFLVDKPDTFDQLSRDARYLERSLQEAGIKADAGSMQFNLRQQPQPQLQSNLDGQGQQSQPSFGQEEESAANDNGVASVASLSMPVRAYTINIRDGVDISA